MKNDLAEKKIQSAKREGRMKNVHDPAAQKTSSSMSRKKRPASRPKSSEKVDSERSQGEENASQMQTDETISMNITSDVLPPMRKNI